MTAVLGGGISGLSAAFYALENPRLSPLVLYEASDRLGGWIHSIKSRQGTLFEKGPRTIRPHGLAGRNTLHLIDKLNLNNKVLPIKFHHPCARNRFIYANNKLNLMPNTLTSLFKTCPPFDRPLFSILWNDFRAPKEKLEDESIYNFIERRLGKDIADYLISPMICGICAGDAKQISVNFLLKHVFEAEQKYGSITKGILVSKFDGFISKYKKKNQLAKMSTIPLEEMMMKEKWSIWGLKGGLEQLPETLTNNLESKVEIHKGKKCNEIKFNKDSIELLFNDGVKKVDRVISSLSAKDLASLVSQQHPQLSKELLAIPFVSVAVVNLRFSGDTLPTKAFGFLVPPNEKLPILGVIFDSCICPQESDTVLTVMMGGAWFETYFGKNPTEEELFTTAIAETRRILNIRSKLKEFDVAILKNCIPQYLVGHNQRLQRIQNYISGHKLPLALCGSSYHGIGLNDAILSAKNAIASIT